MSLATAASPVGKTVTWPAATRADDGEVQVGGDGPRRHAARPRNSDVGGKRPPPSRRQARCGCCGRPLSPGSGRHRPKSSLVQPSSPPSPPWSTLPRLPESRQEACARFLVGDFPMPARCPICGVNRLRGRQTVCSSACRRERTRRRRAETRAAWLRNGAEARPRGARDRVGDRATEDGSQLPS
jgi:hypothetical protein